MPLYAVIDTNVLVSALLTHSDTSPPLKVIMAMYDGIIVPVYSKEILAEYKEVLSRGKFNFSRHVIETAMRAITENGITRSGIPTEETPSDPKDVIFYEVTMDARQEHDAHLVTGNTKDFPAKPFIVTPAEMLRIIEESRK